MSSIIAYLEKSIVDIVNKGDELLHQIPRRYVIMLIGFLIVSITIIIVVVLIVIPHVKRKKIRKSQFRDRFNTCHCDTFISRPSNREGFAKVRAGNNLYKVHEDLENPEMAAKTMDHLNTVALSFIDYLTSKYINDAMGKNNIKPEKWKMVEKSIKSIKKNYKTANLEENIPERSGGDTSYVIDKGDVFAMCLRDPTNGNKIDKKTNDLIFVLLHEICHLGTASWGHDSTFWNNFKFILQEAVAAGLYEPVNYKLNGSPYCGIVITYSPLYDKSLEEYHSS